MPGKVIHVTKKTRRTIRIGAEIEVKVLRIVGSTKAMLRISAPEHVEIVLVDDEAPGPGEEMHDVAPIV